MTASDDSKNDNKETDENPSEKSEVESQENNQTADVERKSGSSNRKMKKLVRRRKSKKEKEKPLTLAIRLVVESGKVDFGSKSGLLASGQGHAKLFVVASRTPQKIKTLVINSANASKIPVVEYEGSTLELGSVCGKPFPVSVLSVFDVGSSNILKLVELATK